MKAIARAQLAAAGVPTVYDSGLCTMCCPPSLFFSHRRDHGITGRQAGLVWLT
jgi:copper oxidase (laccase) domain-containing protein